MTLREKHFTRKNNLAFARTEKHDVNNGDWMNDRVHATFRDYT